MTEIVEKLRGYNPTSGYSRVMREAANMIEALQKQLADECAIHHGNEQVLQRELAEANSLIQAIADNCEYAERKTLESQAREKVLLEALNYCVDNVPEFWTVPGVRDALNQPSDDTAIKAALAGLQVWKDTVIDELVICGIYSNEHESNPRKAMSDALLWNVQVALDPKVSQEARDMLAAEREKSIAVFKKYILPNDHTHFTDGWNACIEEAERAIRARGDSEMPCHIEMNGVRPAKTVRTLGD